MTSKIFFSAMAVSAVTLTTGCSNNEVVDTAPSNAKAISFRVNGDAPQTRTTGTTITYVNAFAVYGDDYVSATPAATLFDGVSVVRQVGAGDIFDYNPKQMYSTGATKAYFYAYSPISTFVSNAAIQSEGVFSFEYENPVPDATGNTTQEDLLYAYTSVTSTSSPVTLAFKHALSRIFVTATNTMTSTDVRIRSLTLKNLYNEGTFEFPFASGLGWDTSGGSVTDLPYVLADSGVVVKANTATASLVTSKEQGMMIIPQATTNTGDNTAWVSSEFALEVVYDKANLKNQTAYICLKNGFAFESNTQYDISIAFTGTEITFEITVTPFTDGSVVLPLNP